MYADNLLSISQDALSVIREVAEEFKLKNNIYPPEIDLGRGLAKKEFNGNKVWTMGSVAYVKPEAKNP